MAKSIAAVLPKPVPNYPFFEKVMQVAKPQVQQRGCDGWKS